MKTRFLPFAPWSAALVTGLIGLAATGSATTALSPLGKWSNPKGTLAVQTAPCDAGKLCGAIVWANPTAMADARDAGITKLIGTQLLQDYRVAGPGLWSGRVYIPDMGRTFSSQIRQSRPNELEISGCLFGHFFCKSQVWHRVP